VTAAAAAAAPFVILLLLVLFSVPDVWAKAFCSFLLVLKGMLVMLVMLHSEQVTGT
jgi:hypothetical protein